MTKEEQIGKLKRLGDDVIYALIDNPYECPIVINKQGIICFMSSICWAGKFIFS